MSFNSLILVADNFQMTKPSISRAVESKNTKAIKKMVESWIMAGARGIDINTGPLPYSPENTMGFLVKAIREVCDQPLFLDTINAKAIQAGLEQANGQAIINGLSLQPEKLKTILPLAVEYRAPVICYLLRPDGHVPRDCQSRLEIALRLWEIASTAGISREQFIIDPVLVPLGWEDGSYQAIEVLDVLRYLPELLGFSPQTIIGLSNLTSGAGSAGQKIAMENAYLPMLAACGIKFILMNINHRRTVELAANCNLLAGGQIFSWKQVNL